MTGQVYLRARFYEPEMNRFSQKDVLRGSITEGTSLNRYLFCQNDPLNYIDPSGMRQVEGNSPNSDSVRRVVQTNNSANTKAAEQRAAAQRAAAQQTTQEKKLAAQDAQSGNPKKMPKTNVPGVESPVQKKISCGAYGLGVFTYHGTDYSIYVPDQQEDYSKWDITYMKSNSKLEIDWDGILRSNLDDFNGKPTRAGYYIMSDGYVTSPSGLWFALFANVLNAIKNNSDSVDMLVSLQQKENENRAIIMARSRTAEETFEEVCNGSRVYLNTSNTVFSLGAAELYGQLTGKDISVFRRYDIAVSYDSDHLLDNGAIAYLWYDEFGNVMGTPIVYENDIIEVGEVNFWGSFKDSIKVPVNYSDFAMPIYDDILSTEEDSLYE